MADNTLAQVDFPALLSGTIKVKSTASVPSERDKEIWQARESGLPTAHVAQHFGIEISTVKNACRVVERFMTSGVAVDTASLKMQNHLRLDAIFREMWTAWRDSGGTKKKTVCKDGPKGQEITVTETEEVGDPRFLMGAMKALSDQRDMWPGANAPKAQSITGPNGEDDAKIDINVKDFSEEKINRIAALIDQLQADGDLPV